MAKKLLNAKGFSLMELLVVILIIGILAAIALPRYHRAVLLSRYTELMVICDGIAKAQEEHYLAQGSYTLNEDDLILANTVSKTGTGWRYSAGADPQTPGIIYARIMQDDGKILIEHVRGLGKVDGADYKNKSMCAIPFEQVGTVYQDVCQAATNANTYYYNDKYYLFFHN